MNKFHIHVDAFELSADFERFLVEDRGFSRSDFAGHPEGVEGYEPPHHLTLKLNDGNQFRVCFDEVAARARQDFSMRGYVEGEFIAEDLTIPEKPFDASVPAPFRTSKTTLPAGSFRESEIHVTLDRDRSDTRLIDALTGMGFFAAYIPKPYGIAQIFTLQGGKAVVSELLPRLIGYLTAAGGSVRCKVKEERIAAWWVSNADLRLPPVVSLVEQS